jgi:hypothetical protein
MLDFHFGEIQFRLAAREKSYSHSSGCETDRKPLSDPPARPGDQSDPVLVMLQAIS